MMDELDNLKEAWKTLSDAQRDKQYSQNELMQLVKRKSNNELLRIRRKLLLEWTMVMVLSVFLVLYIGWLNPSDALFAVIFLLVILGVGFVPYLNLIRFKMVHYTDLRSHLTELITRYDKMVSEYTRMSFVTIPIGVLGGFAFGFHSHGSRYGWSDLFEAKKFILLIALLVIISLGGCYLQKSYFRWLYGRNLNRIKQCIVELDEAEQELNAE